MRNVIEHREVVGVVRYSKHSYARYEKCFEAQRDRTTHIIIDLTPRTIQLSRRFILIRQSTPKIVFHVEIRRVRVVCISNNVPCLLDNYNVLHAEL